MTQQTDKNNWTIPTVGETDNWGQVLNDFFDGELDEDFANHSAQHEKGGSDELTTFGNTTHDSVTTDESRTTSRTITVNVPSDFATIQDALNDIEEIRRTPGLQFEINIESGHTVGKWHVENADLRHVTISSQDSVVNAETGLNTTLLWTAKNAFAPRLNTLVDLQGESYYGFRAMRNAQIYVTTGSGFQNGQRGFNINSGSRLVADDDGTNGLISTGHSERGISLTDGSIARASNADLSNNTDYGLRVGDASMATISYSDVSGCDQGLRVSGPGMIAAQESTGDNCDRFVSAMEGIVLVRGASCDGATTTGIDADRGARILAYNVTITNASFLGAMAQDGGHVVVNGGSITGSGTADIRTARGGIASTHNCTTTSSTSGQPHTSDVGHTGLNETKGIIFGNFETG